MDFNFAFGFAVGLIGAMLVTNHYFHDKIDKKVKKTQEDFSEKMAKDYVERFDNLAKKYPNGKEPPNDELQECIKSSAMKQFDWMKIIFEALDLRFLLNLIMLLWFIAIALWMATGMFPYISIAEISLSGFSIPSMIAGTIAVIFACFGIYRISRKI